jgi:hypothetical protein
LSLLLVCRQCDKWGAFEDVEGCFLFRRFNACGVVVLPAVLGVWVFVGKLVERPLLSSLLSLALSLASLSVGPFFLYLHPTPVFVTYCIVLCCFPLPLSVSFVLFCLVSVLISYLVSVLVTCLLSCLLTVS